MYFDTNCALNNILFSIKLSDDFLLNLHIVCHQAIPSRLIRGASQLISVNNAIHPAWIRRYGAALMQP
jgi:hypothetical protein